MLEQQKNMSPPEKLGTIGSFSYEFIMGGLLRLVTVLCLAYAGLHLKVLNHGISVNTASIENLSKQYADINKQIAEMSKQSAVGQATNAANIELLQKQLSFLDYRITLLEARHGQIYSKFDDSEERRLENDSRRVGSATDIK